MSYIEEGKKISYNKDYKKVSLYIIQRDRD